MINKRLTSILISLSIVAISLPILAEEEPHNERHQPMEMQGQGHGGMKHKGMHQSMGHDAGKTANEPNKEVVLSDIAKQGKILFSMCDSCHSQAHNPAKAPPMFGVKKHYINAYPEKEDFIENLINFVSKPDKENALLQRPVAMLGLMPALPLGEETLTKIATYIYEEQFSRPCEHWKNMIDNAEKTGKRNDHIQQDKRKYQRFCTK